MNTTAFDPNEILVQFMREKAKGLKNVWPDYFTNDDAIAIYEWSFKDACKVLYKLINVPLFLIDAHICPFCIYRDDVKRYISCNRCAYRKRHGNCNNDNSQWMKFTSKYESIVEFLNLNTKEKVCDVVEKVSGMTIDQIKLEIYIARSAE